MKTTKMLNLPPNLPQEAPARDPYPNGPSLHQTALMAFQRGQKAWDAFLSTQGVPPTPYAAIISHMDTVLIQSNELLNKYRQLNAQ